MADRAVGANAPAVLFGMGGQPASGRETPCCLVLGNFDGVHIGHQAILAAALEEARRRRLALAAITFEPHPRTVLDPGLDLHLLCSFELRRRLLLGRGVDLLWVIPFNERVRSMSPDGFMAHLRRRLRIELMVVGPTFSIGRGSEGQLDFLEAYAAREGFGVRVVDSLSWRGEAVSSSRVRASLQERDLGAVSAMLGRPLQVLGQVVHGEGVGRQLGFPTANLQLGRLQALPPDGVYVMNLTTDGGPTHDAVGSIGLRPHFQGRERRFEVHCLDGDPGDLYGRSALVSVLAYLREQEVFESDSALAERMARDAEAAAAHLAVGRP